MCRVSAYVCLYLTLYKKKDLRQLKKMHTVQKTKFKISKRKEGKGKISVRKCHVKIYFLAVKADINTVHEFVAIRYQEKQHF